MTVKDKKYDSAKQKMINGLILLLNEKDFLDIGVKELCEVSNVHRSTFYAHYDNTFELLEDSKNYMISTFLDAYDKKNKEEFEQGKYKDNYITKEYLLPYLKLIKQNKIIYETYAKLHLSLNDSNYFEQLISKLSLPVSRINQKNVDETKIRYITKFYLAGINEIIKSWIKNNFKESEEEICDIITSLVINN